MEITKEGILLTELAPGVTVEEIQAATEATLIVSENYKNNGNIGRNT
jgi:acetate CoA/acetoacetate CoA-transferase beta subunit